MSPKLKSNFANIDFKLKSSLFNLKSMLPKLASLAWPGPRKAGWANPGDPKPSQASPGQAGQDRPAQTKPAQASQGLPRPAQARAMSIQARPARANFPKLLQLWKC